MRTLTKRKNAKYILAAFAMTCVLASAGRAFASETSTEGKPGAAFGTGSDTEDTSTIISDYSNNNTDYGLELTESQTALTASIYYDSLTERYLYITDVGRVEASVMDGMIVTEPVVLSSENTSVLILYKDGERMTLDDSATLEDSGYYVVQYNDNDGAVRTVLEFTIVPSLTGMITQYSMPSGFRATEVTRDGESVAISSNIDLTKEGQYHIAYQCERTQAAYSLDLTIDHTAPVLALDGVENGVAKGPVDLSDAEKDATVAITLDGNDYNYRETLSESGNYVVTITDAAGNESTYEFTIRIYLDSSAYVSILILLAIMAGIVVYMVIERKKLRTR